MPTRRNFLAGAAATALAFGIPIGPVKARFPHGSGQANNLLKARTLIGQGDINGPSYAYINLFKMGTLIAVGQGTTTPFPPMLNSDGYPVTTPSTPYNFGCGEFPPIFYGVTMVVRWTGLGGGQLSSPGMTFTVLTGGSFVSGGTGVKTDFVVFTGTGGYVTLQCSPTSVNVVPSGFSWNFTNFFGVITYDGTMAALECYRLSDEPARNSGEIFLPEYIAVIRALNPRILRSMDWCRPNNTNVTSNTNKMPTTYVCYNSNTYPPGLWAGPISGTTTFTCGAAPQTPGTLTDRETIQVQFLNAPPAALTVTSANSNGGLVQLVMASTASLTTGQRVNYSGYVSSGGSTFSYGQFIITVNSGTQITLQNSVWTAATISIPGTISTATLNVNSRGPSLLANISGGVVDTSTWNANGIATLQYYGWLDIWVVSNVSPASGQVAAGGLFAGWPIENIVALANKLNVNLWYCFSLQYADASVTADVQYIRDHLNSNLECNIEFSNEVWNPGFEQFQLAQRLGVFLGFPDNSGRSYDGYYALRCRQVHGLATAAWSPRSASTLKRVISVWAASPAQTQTASNILDGNDLASVANGGQGNANWISKTGNANYRTAGSRPVDFCDVFAYATYFNGVQVDAGGLAGGQSTKQINNLKAAANAYNSGSTTAAYQWLDTDLRQGVTTPIDITTITGGNTLNTATAHGIGNSAVIAFTSTGALPTGLATETAYYLINGASTSFQVATIAAPSIPLSISGGSGTLTVGALGGSTLLWLTSFVEGANKLGGSNPGWEGICALYDTARAGAGMAPLKVRLYEGSTQPLAPTLSQLSGQSLTTSATVTFNIGASPGVNWTAHPFVNGNRVSFSGGVLPTNIQSGLDYFIMNKTTNGFDISPGYNNPDVPTALLLAGSPSGTTTGLGSQYSLDNIIEGWKNSSFGYQFVTDAYNRFMNVTPGAGAGGSGIGGNHSDVPTWFALQGFSQWSLMSGSFLASKYQTFQANADYNH